MLNIALKLVAASAALLVATPGSAAVQFNTGFASAVSAADAQTYAYSWRNQVGGLLIISPNPLFPYVARGGPESIAPLPPESLAVAAPEPMTWAMMLVGMGVVGWTLRDRRGHSLRRVSFS
jgi:hypothetical protein